MPLNSAVASSEWGWDQLPGSEVRLVSLLKSLKEVKNKLKVFKTGSLCLFLYYSVGFFPM